MLWLIPIATVAVLMPVLGLLSRRRRGRERMVQQFALRVALPITDEVAAALERRVLRRMTFGFAGGIVGTLVGLLLLILVPAIQEWAFAGNLTVALFMCGLALGTAVAAFGQFFSPDPGSPRIARTSQPRLDDYIAPGWMVTAAIASGVGILVVIAAVVVGRPGTPTALTIAAVIFAAISVLVLAVVVLLSRRLLAVPQPANDPTMLAWDDALRTRALRDLWVAPISIGLAAAALGTALLLPERASSLTVLPLTLVSLVPLLFIASNPGTRFQRRLWPETVPRYGAGDAAS